MYSLKISIFFSRLIVLIMSRVLQGCMGHDLISAAIMKQCQCKKISGIIQYMGLDLKTNIKLFHCLYKEVVLPRQPAG